jgi:hypothetical protein
VGEEVRRGGGGGRQGMQERAGHWWCGAAGRDWGVTLSRSLIHSRLRLPFAFRRGEAARGLTSRPRRRLWSRPSFSRRRPQGPPFPAPIALTSRPCDCTDSSEELAAGKELVQADRPVLKRSFRRALVSRSVKPGRRSTLSMDLSPPLPFPSFLVSPHSRMPRDSSFPASLDGSGPPGPPADRTQTRSSWI